MTTKTEELVTEELVTEKFASASYKYQNEKKTVIGFSFETTEDSFYSVTLLSPIEHNHPGVTIIKDREPIFEICDTYWSHHYCYKDEFIKEDKFSEVFKEYFSQFTGYTISNCRIKSILINGHKNPHCLRFELTKETETGIDKHVFSVVPSFYPCSSCETEKIIYIQYKLAGYTINDFLFKSDYSSDTPVTGRKTNYNRKIKKTKRIVDSGDGWFSVKK